MGTGESGKFRVGCFGVANIAQVVCGEEGKLSSARQFQSTHHAGHGFRACFQPKRFNSQRPQNPAEPVIECLNPVAKTPHGRFKTDDSGHCVVRMLLSADLSQIPESLCHFQQHDVIFFHQHELQAS
jgi:hypothetical protein